MKNLSTFAISRMMLIALFALGGFIFSIALITTDDEVRLFKSIDSYLSLKNSTSESKLVGKIYNSNASFLIEDNKIVSINGLKFDILINQLVSGDAAFQEVSRNLFAAYHATSVIFTQEKVMVLPTMKMIHVIGEVSIGNFSRPVALQLTYTYKDQVIHIKGKQSLLLSEYGIAIPLDKQYLIDDELVMDIDLKLVDERLLNPTSNFALNF